MLDSHCGMPSLGTLWNLSEPSVRKSPFPFYSWWWSYTAAFPLVSSHPLEYPPFLLVTGARILFQRCKSFHATPLLKSWLSMAPQVKPQTTTFEVHVIEPQWLLASTSSLCLITLVTLVLLLSLGCIILFFFSYMLPPFCKVLLTTLSSQAPSFN